MQADPETQPSYVSGVSDVALIGETIGAHFDRAAGDWAQREALVVCHQGIRWTYGELRERVDQLAAGLIRLGLEPGERIGIWSPNNAEWVLLQLASAKAGLILTTLNPAYRAQEIEQALVQSGCRALVSAVRFKSSEYLEILKGIAPEIEKQRAANLQLERLPDLQILIHLGQSEEAGMLRFADLPVRDPSPFRGRLGELDRTLQFDDPINIQFTSGTTGRPKGAVLTHHNILNNGFFCGERMRLTPEDRLCIPVPLYHCFGMVLGVLASITHGAAMVFPIEGFDPLAVLEAVEAERCTALHGVPSMFIAELEHPESQRFDLTSLRTGIMAGAPCPIEVMRRVASQMHLTEITIAYGMTETSPVSFQSSVDDALERRVSTVGRIHPHLEVKIVDSGGRIVPRGVAGELLTRGYAVMLGYWNDPEGTHAAIDDAGWMHSGDLATIDAEGYANIVGRIKDVIIRGGENIFPREIEEFLFQHPKIQSVQVFGVPDPKYGEQVCAWIRVRDEDLTEAEVRQFCEGQIAHYKVPRIIRFVDAFPLTVTGKPQKYRMREAMMEELGLSDAHTA